MTSAGASARVADLGDDAPPGAFFEEMDARGAGADLWAQNSKSWGDWCNGEGAGQFQFKRSDAAEIEVVASAGENEFTTHARGCAQGLLAPAYSDALRAAKRKWERPRRGALVFLDAWQPAHRARRIASP